MTASVSNHVETSAPATRTAAGRNSQAPVDAKDSFETFVKGAEQAPKAARAEGRNREADETESAASDDATADAKAGDEAGATASDAAAASQRTRDNTLAAILADMDRLLRSGTANAAALADTAEGEATSAADATLARIVTAKDEKAATNPFAQMAASDGDETVSKLVAMAGETLGAGKASSGEQPARARVDLVSQRTDFEPADNTAGASAVVAGKPGGAATTNIRQMLASAELRGSDGASMTDGEMPGEPDMLDVLAGREAGDPRRARGETLGERADRERGRDGVAGKTSASIGVTAQSVESPMAGQTAAAHGVGRQVADAVTTSLAGAALPTGDTGEAARLQMRAGGAALKTIQIQLQPEQLGKLDVTMRLIDGQLAIHIVASEAETALRLKDDAEGLKTLLSKAGFTVDEAAISIGMRDATALRGNASGLPAQGQADGQSAGGQAGNGAARDGAAGSGGNGSASQRDARSDQAVAAPTGEESSARRRDLDPSIYL
ncbi:flagellar hook-length control protein FliK [Aurantimonas sp. A2-1-M11]|uniref:flagellar hook-length control protein FliK n=1 Tax=Aurantimonas sp. A2-1-M11 TaxID=3113712 RepID=UPI002F927652